MKKKDKYIIRVVAVLLLVIGTTFAYFVAQSNKGANSLFKVTAHSVDDFEFTISKNISLTMNQFNFASDSGNLSDSSVATASLKANSSTNSANYNYNVDFYILENSFEYSSVDHKPEIVLTVTDPTGAEVKSIDGLTYYTSITNADGNSISGFDITTKSGLISVASDSITSSSSTVATTKKWTFKITIINLDINQLINQNKKINARIIMKKEGDDSQTLAEACTLENFSTCLKTNYKMDEAISYHTASEANSAIDNSYRYSGGDYILTKKAKDAGYLTLVTSSASDNTGVINFYCDGNKSYVGAACSSSLTNYYSLAYNTTKQYSSYLEVLNQATLDGYLSGDNVKNFVCFGSSESSCPEDNLYRIIGIFDNKIKLIKYNYASKESLGTNGDYRDVYTTYYYSGVRGERASKFDRYYWNYKKSNASSSDWSTSLLNSVNLNTNFLNYLGSNWKSKIADSAWKVSGYTTSNITATSMYNEEITNATKSLNAKIGLMYISDFGFAADKNMWSTKLNSYRSADIKSSNWMYMGLHDWTITPNSGSSTSVFNIDYFGNLDDDDSNLPYAIRPVFYLNSDVVLVGGTGTMSDPYIIG